MVVRHVLRTRAYKKKNGSKIRKSQPVFIVGFGRPAFGQAVKPKTDKPVVKKAAPAKPAKGGGAKPAVAK
jgi:hypothetical protein